MKFFEGFDAKQEQEDLLKEQAKQKASFCLATGIAPSEYDGLTQIEINEFIAEANRQAERSKK